MSDWVTDSSREYLKTLLSNEIVSVRFTKRDGTERTMFCTRSMEMIPEENHPKGVNIKENPDVIRVWSTEDEGWRSFRYDSILGLVPAMVIHQKDLPE